MTDTPDRSGAVVTIVGDGVVGRRVRRLLGDRFQVRNVDLRNGPLEPVGGNEVVVLAMPVPHAPVAADLARAGVPVVSVGDDLGDVRELLDLDHAFRSTGTTLVVAAGMSPGLSCLLARHLVGQLAVCDEIHVAQHATAGPACARQHHRALAGRAVGRHDGRWIERPGGSGRELCWFPEPVGAHDCYRAEIPGPVLLHREFPDVSRITARMSATRRDRLTARLPMLRRPHPEGGVGALRVEVRGADEHGTRVTLVSGVAENVGAVTAATAATFAEAAVSGHLPTGAVTASDEMLDTLGLLTAITRHGVRLQEFTGVPQHV